MQPILINKDHLSISSQVLLIEIKMSAIYYASFHDESDIDN